jgi:hypothetical protein
MTTTRNPDSFAAGWFWFGLGFFSLAMVGGLATIAFGPLEQVQVLGGATTALAAIGALVSLLGVRTYDPRRWARLRNHASSVGESLQDAREAIGEPRQLAYAQAPRERQRGGSTPRVVWPV